MIFYCQQKYKYVTTKFIVNRSVSTTILDLGQEFPNFQLANQNHRFFRENYHLTNQSREKTENLLGKRNAREIIRLLVRYDIACNSFIVPRKRDKVGLTNLEQYEHKE